MKAGISEQERKVVDFIASFIEVNRYSPSLTEIAEGTGMASSSSALGLVKRLVEKGWITKRSGQRTIALVEENDGADKG